MQNNQKSKNGRLLIIEVMPQDYRLALAGGWTPLMSMLHTRRPITALCAGMPRGTYSIYWRPPVGPPPCVPIDSTAAKAHRCAARSQLWEWHPIFGPGSTAPGNLASRRFCAAIAMPSSICLDASRTSEGLQYDTIYYWLRPLGQSRSGPNTLLLRPELYLKVVMRKAILSAG